MTLPYAGPGYSMNRPKRPPVDCAVCTKPIENPGPFQKVHPGKCHREWNNRNSAKHHAKRKAAKLAKRDRKRVGAIKGIKPERNPRYLAWIRTLECIVCSWWRNAPELYRRKGLWLQTTPTEAAHTGPHGIGQKASDYTCIPLCKEHHTEGRESYHKLGERKFRAKHGLIVVKLTEALRARYEAQRRDAA